MFKKENTLGVNPASKITCNRKRISDLERNNC